jgi:hypothetical protein
MFLRVKQSEGRRYLQLVENRWESGHSRQRVMATLGRLERLQATGQVDGLLRSLARFAEQVKVVEAHAQGHLAARSVKRIGPNLVMARLWQRLGLAEVLTGLLQGRRHSYAVERMIYFTVLSRLFFPGSDRRALRVARDYKLALPEAPKLHQLYRAMAWLGQVQEEVEERLFTRNRNLFTGLDVVFFDTTSLYFEGHGGESLGRHGYSKDGCPEERQLIVGAVIDATGRPISCPMWPGNTSDVTTLQPVIERLRDRFGVKDVVVVADRGMISKRTVEWLEAAKLGYILGVRMRQARGELRDAVTDAGGGCQVVKDNLQVKAVTIAGRRYVVCFNPEEAARDAATRDLLLASLRKRLKQGAASVVGNRGFRQYLKIEKTAVTIDEEKVAASACFDGKYVLQTNTGLGTEAVALKYKELWQVERVFREVKSVLETRPVYHKYDLTIKGHVFCSFLALVVMKELLKAVGPQVSWDTIRQDLDALCETEVEQEGERYLLRSPLLGECGKVLSAIGIAVPPSVVALTT